MTKQEFLAMSLPYKLKIKDSFSTPNLTGIMDNEYHFGSYLSIDGVEEIKPILRPLSDLIKPIEHKGETFMPTEWFEIGDADNDSIEYDYGNIKLIKTLETISINNVVHDIAYLPFAVVLKLIEWKFDIADLISKGEAIDVNTLDINPYK